MSLSACMWYRCRSASGCINFSHTQASQIMPRASSACTTVTARVCVCMICMCIYIYIYIYIYICISLSLSLCARACARAHVRACESVCVRACACVCARAVWQINHRESCCPECQDCHAPNFHNNLRPASSHLLDELHFMVAPRNASQVAVTEC